MSWRTSVWVVSARNLGRALGLNKWIASFLQGDGYEMEYDNNFSATLRPGDCVWDVGANVGYYTKMFSERVGSKGLVFSFEPSPVNFDRLGETCTVLDNVTLVRSGLGLNDEELSFEQGSDELGATSRIVESGGGQVVEIRSGRSLIRDGVASPPNIIKIDVEGFEYEVLKGLGDHLSTTSLRAIGIEVHFRILKERGMANVPKKIESLLHENGFVVSWPDSSHIIATRSS